jgi:hypothetical protein
LNRKGGFFANIPTSANVIGLGSVAIWTVKATIFDHIAAPWDVLFDLGRVFEGVLSAIFAGYVFYILFALWPEYRDKRTIAPHVLHCVGRIVGDCNAVVSEVGHASGMPLALASSTASDIEAACNATPMLPGPRMVVGSSGIPATWVQYFGDYRSRASVASRALYDHSRYLSSELVSLISEINDCIFFNFVDAVRNTPVGNQTLAVFGSPMADYAEACMRLARWHDEHLDAKTLPILPVVVTPSEGS